MKEELKKKMLDLYNYMAQNEIGEVVVNFEDGNKISCHVEHKPITLNLDKILGE